MQGKSPVPSDPLRPARASGRRRRRASSPSCAPGWLTTGPVDRAVRGGVRPDGRRAPRPGAELGDRGPAPRPRGAGSPARALLVITTPYTFAATAEVIRYVGADPLFVDIDGETLNIDPEGIARALHSCRQASRPVAAILPVHVGGLPCDMARIGDLAQAFRVPVVEDAAHAFPVRAGGGSLGTLGDAGVYSFYATKTITTGEGGMVATDRDDVARRIRVMRLHGIDRDIWNRYTSGSASWKYDVVAPGYKYNLTDIASAIGRVQLDPGRGPPREAQGHRRALPGGIPRAGQPPPAPRPRGARVAPVHRAPPRRCPRLRQGHVHRGAAAAGDRHLRALHPPAPHDLLQGKLRPRPRGLSRRDGVLPGLRSACPSTRR